MSFVAQISGFAPPLTPMQMDVTRSRAQARDAKGNLVFPGAQPWAARLDRLVRFTSRQPFFEQRVEDQAVRWALIRHGAWDQLQRDPATHALFSGFEPGRMMARGAAPRALGLALPEADDRSSGG